MADAHLRLCSSCDGAAGLGAVRAALAGAGLAARVTVGEHACFNVCDRPVSLVLQGAGRATYVFSGLDPVADAGDIAATCALYLDAPKGWIADARGCGRLRACLHARIPALDSGS